MGGSQRARGVEAPMLVIVTLAIALGIFFRFYHIDRKVYWGDEVYTSLRMLGATEADLVRRAPGLHDVHDLQLVLHPVPAEGATDPLAPALGLALEEPHHPPLYYELAHFWVGVLGNSISTTRSLSALISLFALPLAFWLGLELYGSRRAGWIAAALAALSPVAVIYAQEAREYALWSVALLALNAAVLRALRIDRLAAWWLVAVLTAFSLYVFPLTFLPLAGLAAYVIATRWQSPRVLLRCGLAFAAGTLAFLPWLAILLQHLHAVTDSLASTLRSHAAAGEVLRAFTGSLRLGLFDPNLVRSSHPGVAATAISLLTLVAAFAFVVRRERPQVWLFLALPILFTTLPLLIPDLLTGGERVRNPRYFTPAYIYFDYCLVGLLYAATAARSASRALAGYGLLVVILAANAASCFFSSQATTWWSKMEDNSIAVAGAIDRSSRPVVVSDAYLDYALVLSNYLRPDVKVALRPPCYECADRAKESLDASLLPSGQFTDLFALGPSPQLQRFLRALIARRHLKIAYHCINVRHSCASDLNVEPVFSAERSNGEEHVERAHTRWKRQWIDPARAARVRRVRQL
jgi:uncharacterized membrane protein